MKTKTNPKGAGRPQKGCYKRGLAAPIVYKSFSYDGAYTVYGLASTETPETVNYVGVTARDLNLRLNDHVSYARLRRSKKERWISDVLQRGERIILITLEEGIKTMEEAYAKEMYYIELMGKIRPLTNTTKGGRGTFGMKHSNETRKKQSEANKGNHFRTGLCKTGETVQSVSAYRKNRRQRARESSVNS